ncbi:MAG: AmmeMemoRadiSam system radical SAM enzyme [Proteobacteria bacterium]|nr:AmmeMemoRadiSam system radical SAM enzyme [Pseudomonadota bacterium]
MSLSRRDFLSKGSLLCLGLGILGGIPGCSSKPNEKHVSKSGRILQEARYYEKQKGGMVRCRLCFRQCLVADGDRGFCRNRENHGGTYYTLVYGLPCAIQIDPIEKEPSYHMLPGSFMFCTATASCNNRCKFCHNWHISQRSVEETINFDLSPVRIVGLASEQNCESLSFTYSEPTVFYEYMYDIAKLGKEKGLKILFHTNGSMNPEPLSALLQHMDGVTVDLKGFTETFYREASSSELAPVLRTLRHIRESRRHLEVVNLVIPTLNDDMVKIREMCVWITENLGKDIPLHFTRFSPAYKLTHLPPTPIETLERARKIAQEEGLEYVYIGNVPGHEGNNTFCPQCHKKLIHRVHFAVLANEVKEGKCPSCGYPIRGIWADAAA